MKGNFHVRFGERGGETRWPQGQKVRSAPTLRTAGFLISANRYILDKNNPDDWTEAQQRKYRRDTFYGMEFVQDAHRLALMNLMLHGLASDPAAAGIRYGDTLSPEGEALPKATLILTNPPFGTKKGGGLPSRDRLHLSHQQQAICLLAAHLPRTQARRARRCRAAR